MSKGDEPVLGDDFGRVPESEDRLSLEARIRTLVTTQPYAVLCTHGGNQAYGSLVAFAFAEDLCAVVFATSVATRKYRLLSEHDQVALVVDDRPDYVHDMMQVEAITATGHAFEINTEPDRSHFSKMLVSRHPQLGSFVTADSCALFQIKITRFFHVTRFQEVRQWIPTSRS